MEIKQARFGEFWRPRIKWNSECTRFVCWIGVIRVRSCRFRSSVWNLVCWRVHDCRGLLRGTLGCYAWLCTEMLERSFLMISFTVNAIGNHVTFRLHPKQTIVSPQENIAKCTFTKCCLFLKCFSCPGCRCVIDIYYMWMIYKDDVLFVCNRALKWSLS